MPNQDINLPSVEDAVGTLDAVYADVFFSKLAELGFAPRTEEGMLSALETAAYLDAVDGGQKQASVDPFVDANAKLKQALANEQLINPAVFAQQSNAAIKQAAFAMAQHPDLYKAVLAVKTAQAQN